MKADPTIFVDSLRPCLSSSCWPWRESAHLFCEPGNLDALHAFAAGIGLKREWFQDHGRLPHYDLNAGRRRAAVTSGAVECDGKVLVETMRSWRKKT